MLSSVAMEEVVDFRVESSEFDCDALQIFEVEGRESISQLFAFDIGVVSTQAAGLDPGAVQGALACLVMEVGGVEVRRVHGMISQVEDLMDTEPATRTYRLRLVPRMFRLSLVHTQDIFMDLSVPDIIAKKLELLALDATDVEWRLLSTYAPRDFVVQYKETDLAFVQRLAEHEGISFFFDCADGKDKIIFTDHAAGFQPVADHAVADFRGKGEARDVYALTSLTRVIPHAHVVHDYNYRSPMVDPTGSSEAPSGLAGGVVEYGAHVRTPADATKLAQVRAQETETKHVVYTGRSDLGWMSAGFPFTLDGHPRQDDLGLLVTEIEHRVRKPVALQSQGEIPYHNTFRAISSSLTFRPPRVTPRPHIHGVLHAVVESESPGAETKFARLDSQGRYIVRMMYDTSGAEGRAAFSHRVRMAQPHTGTSWGMHLPLKPGTEVLVAFIDGDPDRPVIVGAVPNPVTRSVVIDRSAPAHRIRTETGILIEMKDA